MLLWMVLDGTIDFNVNGTLNGTVDGDTMAGKAVCMGSYIVLSDRSWCLLLSRRSRRMAGCDQIWQSSLLSSPPSTTSPPSPPPSPSMSKCQHFQYCNYCQYRQHCTDDIGKFILQKSFTISIGNFDIRKNMLDLSKNLVSEKISVSLLLKTLVLSLFFFQHLLRNDVQ